MIWGAMEGVMEHKVQYLVTVILLYCIFLQIKQSKMFFMEFIIARDSQ